MGPSRRPALPGDLPSDIKRHHRLFTVGKWWIDPLARTATCGGKVLRLSPRSLQVLVELVTAAGEVVERKTLMRRVWTDVTVSDESLTQAIAELRRTFGDTRGAHRHIETVQKTGYRLAAPVAPAPLERAEPRRPQRVAGSVLEARHLSCQHTDGFDLGAYSLVLEARDALLRGDRGAVSRAEALCGQAIEQAPRCALARAQAAIVLVHRGLYQGGGNADLMRAAGQAGHAVRLRPDLAICHAANGFALDALGVSDKARGSFARAIATGRDDGEAHYLAARCAFASGDTRTAASLAQQAAHGSFDLVRPLFLATRAATGFDLERAQGFARACLVRVRATLTADPQDIRSRSTVGPLLALLGDHSAASAALTKSNSCGSICQIHDVLGHAALGDVDAALLALEATLDHGYSDARWLPLEPLLEPLQRERRFKKALSALHATPRYAFRRSRPACSSSR
ncbi:MAG: transcriptional regulator [Pseudomonadota bacterium]